MYTVIKQYLLKENTNQYSMISYFKSVIISLYFIKILYIAKLIKNK